VKSKDAFAQKFGSEIRMYFNWSRLMSEEWPVEIVTISGSNELAALRLPWCLSSKNEFVSFETEDGFPVRLSEVGVWFAYLPTGIRDKIERFESEFRHAPRHVSFDFPAYAIPMQQHLVLDGNHKLCALTRSGVPFRLQMWAVNGPLDETVLPDLRHFLS